MDKLVGALKALAKDAEETVYSYNYGGVHFIVLNSGNYTSNDMYMLEAQRKWLEADLKANADAKWTIITVHEPVYHRLGGNESRPWLGDLIEEYGVDLVIQGHSHLVTRTYPMKDGKIVTKESPDLIKKGTGTVYTTIGATAYNHDSMGNPNVEECLMIATPSPELAAYTVVTVSDSKIVMTVKQIDGLVLDSFTIEADGSNTSHAHKETLANKKEASCKEAGYTGDKICSECNEILVKGEVIPQNENHVFGEWIIVKEPTTTECGEQTRTCSLCGESESQTLTPICGGAPGDKKGCGGINIAASLVSVIVSALAFALTKKKS